MSNTGPSNLPILINIESKDFASEDSEWQEECHKLYTQIKNSLEEGTIEPLKIEDKSKGHRGGFLEMFNVNTVAVGVSTMALVVDITKLWLERRKACEAVFRFPDGSEMKVSKASKEDILKMYEKQLAKHK